MTKPPYRLMLILLMLAAPSAAFADASISEFSIAAGGSASSVVKPAANQFIGEKTYKLGGPLILGGITVYQSSRVVARTMANLVIDVSDSAVLRHGLVGSFGYHILGGPLNRVESHESATIGSNYPYCLTVVIQPAINIYRFPDTSSSPPRPLNATVLEAFGGLEFTRAFFFDTSIGLSILGSLKSLYVSGDKVSNQTIDALVTWRTAI